MTAMTAAGTILAISATAPNTFDETGFGALSFSDIGEITDIGGNLGRVFDLVTHQPLATRATQKYKGGYNSGSGTITMALDENDAGQLIAAAALLSDEAYSFKLTRQDGSIRYFRAMAMGFPETYGGVNTIVQRTLTIEITTDDSGNDFVDVAS